MALKKLLLKVIPTSALIPPVIGNLQQSRRQAESQRNEKFQIKDGGSFDNLQQVGCSNGRIAIWDFDNRRDFIDSALIFFVSFFYQEKKEKQAPKGHCIKEKESKEDFSGKKDL